MVTDRDSEMLAEQVAASTVTVVAASAAALV